MREFIMSCSYGVLAGTLVGAATLAFSDKPGDNLNKVARGASIGLYAGILLGLYVVYGVPSEEEDPSALAGLKGADLDDLKLSIRPVASVRAVGARLMEPPRFQLMPVLGDKGVEGAVANVSLLRF